MATVGLSKVFILDKYFAELQKYLETEEKSKADFSSTLKFCVDDDNNETPGNTYDLINLIGPLTEDNILKALDARFCDGQYFTHVGPVLLCINSYSFLGNPLTLSSLHTETSKCPQLLKVVQESIRQQSETGYSQAIILSGCSGSGKTFTSMLLLRQLFNVAGGGHETDSFRYLGAAFTVLRSLGAAKTANNLESSRIGQFIEVQVCDGAIYRTKIHCYFLDQTRVLRQYPNEKNYHIFYQMLAGLTKEERVKLNLEGYNVHNLKYLNRGDINQNEYDSARFESWKNSLSLLGIPFMDVVRVLAAILLLGNINFDGEEDEPKNELKGVASLLGVSSVTLIRGLTTKTTTVRGQTIKCVSDGITACYTRDCLAQALYVRTVATIVRRANSMRRLGSSCGTMFSSSNESIQCEARSVSSGGSILVLNKAVKHATNAFIGILDMFGFEDSGPSHLEHLCINLCAETMQHFYNTHIFKTSTESCREEGIISDIEIDYVDNVPCIDFISSLRTGLLSILDSFTPNGTPSMYVAAVANTHSHCSRYYQTKTNHCSNSFGIRHFAGNVVYDCSGFIQANKDTISSDLIHIFSKNACTFGFVSHLFASELRILKRGLGQSRDSRDTGFGSLGSIGKDFDTEGYNADSNRKTDDDGIIGFSFRISPTSSSYYAKETGTTLTCDFHTRLDNLLRTLVHARPHFIRCIKSNNKQQENFFERTTVMRQIRALQVLETVNLMACGLPHRMRFRAFYTRYRCIAPIQKDKTSDRYIEDCKMLISRISTILSQLRVSTPASCSLVFGHRHVFLSEAIRQQLELLRGAAVNNAATVLQYAWRRYYSRKRTIKSRPMPINGTPPPEKGGTSLLSWDKENPPPLPPSRSYTVTGNAKLRYPQTRVMKIDYPDPTNSQIQLMKGEKVLVIAASNKRGHLVVEHGSITMDVPYQYMELKTTALTTLGINI